MGPYEIYSRVIKVLRFPKALYRTDVQQFEAFPNTFEGTRRRDEYQ